MHQVAVRLDEWRQAERTRDALTIGCAQWRAADDVVRSAQMRYRAESSQVTAYYRVSAIDIPDPWWLSWSLRWPQQTVPTILAPDPD
jgi:hypothetical protein